MEESLHLRLERRAGTPGAFQMFLTPSKDTVLLGPHTPLGYRTRYFELRELPFSSNKNKTPNTIKKREIAFDETGPETVTAHGGKPYVIDIHFCDGSWTLSAPISHPRDDAAYEIIAIYEAPESPAAEKGKAWTGKVVSNALQVNAKDLCLGVLMAAHPEK